MKVTRQCFLGVLVGFKEIGYANFVYSVDLVRRRQRMNLVIISHGEDLQLRVDGLEAFTKRYEEFNLGWGVCQVGSRPLPIYGKSVLEA